MRLNLTAALIFKPVDRVGMRVDPINTGRKIRTLTAIPPAWLRTCTRTQREAVILRHEQGCTFPEIAAVIGGTRWRARGQYRRGIAKLIEQLPDALAGAIGGPALDQIKMLIPRRRRVAIPRILPAGVIPRQLFRTCTPVQRRAVILRHERGRTFREVAPSIGRSRRRAMDQYRIGIAKAIVLMPAADRNTIDPSIRDKLEQLICRQRPQTQPVPSRYLTGCTPRQRQAFILRTRRQMTFKAIGEKMGCGAISARSFFTHAWSNVFAELPEDLRATFV